MKIPQSVRLLYEDLLPKYKALKAAVDKSITNSKGARWHYEGRIKEDESFALKLETGRVKNIGRPEDFFACTVVVENHARITDAERFICTLFKLEERKPRKPDETHLPPYSFDFDDLRLYVTWVDDPALKPTGLAGMLFEVQIKTFLQHAWGIATHDFVYKSHEVDWSASRIAYQVKAMLENAELSISEAQRLTTSAMLSKLDRGHSGLLAIIAKLKERWGPDLLPRDFRRLAQIIDELLWNLRIDCNDLWAAVDEASAVGEGAKLHNLSPYGAILTSLIRKRGADFFNSLERAKANYSLFVPLEIDLPPLSGAQQAKIIRPPRAT